MKLACSVSTQLLGPSFAKRGSFQHRPSSSDSDDDAKSDSTWRSAPSHGDPEHFVAEKFEDGDESFDSDGDDGARPQARDRGDAKNSSRKKKKAEEAREYVVSYCETVRNSSWPYSEYRISELADFINNTMELLSHTEPKAQAEAAAILKSTLEMGILKAVKLAETFLTYCCDREEDEELGEQDPTLDIDLAASNIRAADPCNNADITRTM